MHDLLKDSDLSTVHSMATCIIGCPSSWTSTALQIEQSRLSKSLSLKMATPPPHCQSATQLGFYFQDQDLSSTQSTGQSYPGVASVGESNPYGQSTCSVNKRCNGSHGKLEEARRKSALSMGTQDCVLSPQVDYGLHACVPLSYPEPFHHGLLSTYGPQSMMMGVASTRVPLPLDVAQDEPIYVNVKQYHAILRRRQYRAKLESQNKVSKNRKPYLHESRHLHALKRARGSGGRFLNMKKLAESESTPNVTHSEQDVSRSSQLRKTRKMLESEFYLRPENYKEVPTTSYCSDITNVLNNASIFQQQESGFSGYPSRVGRPMQGGGVGQPGGIQHHLSVIR